VHSRYARRLADLPWYGQPVRLLLEVRKFFCDVAACRRKIFAERVPQVAAVYARQTGRLAQALVGVAFACGGEGGARLALRLGMPTSPDTLLRRIRQTPLVARGTPRVLGVDDWAVRRGQRYGTILCDLEQHRAVDLLGERSAEALSGWLRARPGIEVITRDRAAYYAQGATSGAPQAVQVADRWHLLHNLREALVRLLDRHHPELRAAARAVTVTQEPRAPPGSPEPTPPPPSPPSPIQQRSQARRARRVQRYERVLELHRQGVSQRAIARRLGMNRCTVRRFLRAGQFPERATRAYRSRTEAVADYLRQHWEEGCHNAAQLTRELASRGFDGSYDMVRRRVARWRSAAAAKQSLAPSLSPGRPLGLRPSSNRVAWWLLADEQKLTPRESAFMDALRRGCPEVEGAAGLAREFVTMVRQHKPEALEEWIARTHTQRVGRELRTFAVGLKSDYAAVKAALTTHWSNGQVEGQVNRLKLLKRQMYGRAKFDLLRLRVLHIG
jgi:transposase